MLFLLLLSVLFKLIAGVARADGDLALVPVPVLLQGVEDVLGVWLHEVGPGLPQGMDDVVNETHL